MVADLCKVFPIIIPGERINRVIFICFPGSDFFQTDRVPNDEILCRLRRVLIPIVAEYVLFVRGENNILHFRMSVKIKFFQLWPGVQPKSLVQVLNEIGAISAPFDFGFIT